jgi:hypothetical protein
MFGRKFHDKLFCTNNISLLLNNIFISFFSSQWNPYETSRLINFIEQWKTCLPECVLDNLLDETISPKLNQLLDSWDSNSDSKSIYKFADQ